LKRPEERHWSQTEIEPPPRRTLFVEVIFPEFGKAVVLCECGARVELIAQGQTGKLGRGRPKRPITVLELAEEWAAGHIANKHQSLTQWELRHRYQLTGPGGRTA